MSDDRLLQRCQRTAGLIDRVVADRVTSADREHASTCPRCGPVLLRSVRFEAELSRVTRDLVTERLPNGILDDDLAPAFRGGFAPLRRAAPGLASIFAAVVILVLATSLALAPGGFGNRTPPPTSLGITVPVFRATTDIIRDLRDGLGYDCLPGYALPTTGPSARLGEREGVRCLTPESLESAKALMTPIETGDGRTVAITVEGSLYGTETLKSEIQLAAAMREMTFISIADHQAATQAAAFVEGALPRLRVAASGDDAAEEFGNVRVELQRSIAGGYRLTILPIPQG